MGSLMVYREYLRDGWDHYGLHGVPEEQSGSLMVYGGYQRDICNR